MALSPGEENERQQLLAEAKGSRPTPVQNNSLSPDEEKERQALLAESGQPQPESPGLLARGLDTTARTLDYPGGYARGTVAGIAGDLMGKKLVTPEDEAAMFVGKGPRSAEYLERAGVTEGPSAEIPYLGHTSLRDAEGFALDVASDPLGAVWRGAKAAGGLVSRGVEKGLNALPSMGRFGAGARGAVEAVSPGISEKAIPAISKAAGTVTETALNPVGKAAESAGESLYLSGLKKIDQKMDELGAKKFTDVMEENGYPVGGTKDIQKAANDIATKTAQERKGIYDQVNKSGVKIDMKGEYPNVKKIIDRAMRDPQDAEIAEEMQTILGKYQRQADVPIDLASEWKTNLYNKIPKSAYAPNGAVAPLGKQFSQALAADLRQKIIQGGESAAPGLGKKIDALNENWGTLIASENPIALQISRETTRNAATRVDAMLAAAAPGVLAAKKAQDIALSTGFKTRVGRGLMSAGQNGAAQGLMNRGLINSQRGLVNGQN